MDNQDDPRVQISREIAYEIERELICCTEYDDFHNSGIKGTYRIKHQICWWGSYARNIAIKVGNKYADSK